MIDHGEEYLDDDESEELLQVSRAMRRTAGSFRDKARRRGHPTNRDGRVLGRNGAGSSRQVNVKLAVADFEALHELALTRDLPTATLARMLLRDAIRESREG